MDHFITLSLIGACKLVDELAFKYPVTRYGLDKIRGTDLNYILNTLEEKKPIEGYELFSVAGTSPIYIIFKKCKQ